LREVLGEGVQQKGSLVDPDKLRFDFSHGQPLGEAELERVEQLVNQSISRKLPVYAENAPQEQALKINGLRAVFGEKYPPMVRVVSIGAPVADLLKDPSNPKWRQFSVEFCGGTHLKNSEDVERFIIVSEESVSKGVRRVVAFTGKSAQGAHEAAAELSRLLADARGDPKRLPELQRDIQLALRAAPLLSRRRGQVQLSELQAQHKALEKEAKSGPGLDVQSAAATLLALAPSLGTAKLIVGQVPGATPEQLLAVTDSLKKKSGSYAVLLASAADGKVSFVAAVSDDLIAKGLKAGDWIRQAAQATGGGGGGRPQLAQAGGKDPAKVPDALKLAGDYAMRFAK
jgi:alanyl-tRNA synthetase